MSAADSASAASGERAVAVGGDIVDSVVVTGDHNDIRLGLGAPVGAVLALLGLRRRPKKKARRTPLRPSLARYANQVDREDESLAVAGGAGAAGAVNLYGSAGVGKTYVLADAVNRREAMALSDGIVYLYGRERPRGDLLQVLFEEFFDCRPPFKATEAQIRADLARKRALVVVDDAELERNDLQQFVAAAPGCRFVVASEERTSWDGAALRLEGLRPEDARALVEQELGRPLEPEERQDADRICAVLQGHPLRIRQAVAVVREDGRSLADVAARLGAGDAQQTLPQLVLDPLDDEQTRVLQALAVFNGAAVGTEHVGPVAGVANAAPVLEALERRGLAESHSPRYSVAENLVGATSIQAGVPQALDRGLDYFTRWLERSRPNLAAHLAEADALLELLRTAVSRERFGRAIELGKALDAALAWGRRFDAWGQLHELVLEAARKSHDRPAEAWALHQQGTRAAALGDLGTAEEALPEASRIRRELGDDEGARVSEENLAVARAVAVPPRGLNRLLLRLVRLPILTLVIAVGALLLASGGGAVGIWCAATGCGGNHPPPPTTSASLVVVKEGTGHGTVTSVSAKIDCGSACEEKFATGTRVRLQEAPAPGSRFAGWSRGCSSSRPTCAVTVIGRTGVIATFEPIATGLLRVRLGGGGKGAVKSTPKGIVCGGGGRCAAPFALHESVVLSAEPAAGSRFVRWGGGCSGEATCSVSIGHSVLVTAIFARVRRAQPVHVAEAGSGHGRVTSTPAGIDCPQRCDASFARGQTVLLSARAASGSVFSGWSGDCSGKSSCRLHVSAARSVTATFQASKNTRTLKVARQGNGTGTVQTDPSGVRCPTVCSASFADGEEVTLTATPTAGSTFGGWSGAGCGKDAVCRVTMHSDVSVAAVFNAVPVGTLTVNRSGPGVVTSDPQGIDCGTTCRAPFPLHTSVRLTAEATAGAKFVGWSYPGCAGTGPCVVRFDKSATVAATFKPSELLTVRIRRGGSVRSDPGGIDCGSTCQAPFAQGTPVTLTATPAAGWMLVGWQGDLTSHCTKNAPCQVLMDKPRTLYAIFGRVYTLTIGPPNNGTITSDVGGIDCGKTCQATFPSGTVVTLTAAPAASGYSFDGWTGPCKGSNLTCTLTMTGPMSTTASFSPLG